MKTTKKATRTDVYMGIQAIEHFYKKYQAKFDAVTIVYYTLALHEFFELRDPLELTPCEKAFRRIVVRRPTPGISNPKQIFMVFGYDNLDRAKTDELNELVNRFTKNAFVPE